MHFLSGLLGNLWSVFLIVLFFGGSIFVHELGHFLAARRRGARVDRFSIGFGPAIWSWHGKDGVEYRLAWLPLGGYVLLPQLADLGALEGEVTSDATRLPPVSYATKMIVFVAGAFFNLLFAFALASILWFIGRPAPETTTSTTIGRVLPTITTTDGKEVPSPALKAGLQVGDIIRAVDGKEVHYWDQFKTLLVLSTKVSEQGERAATLLIERHGQLQNIPVTPMRAGDDRFRMIGISPAFSVYISKVVVGSHSELLGFKAGDKFVAYDDTEALSFDQVSEYLSAHPESPIVLTVLRDNLRVKIAIPATPKGKPHPLSGLRLSERFQLLYESPWQQCREVIFTTYQTVWSLISPRGDLSISSLSGPIGIGRGFWEASNSEFPIRYALWFAVLVNLNLAIFNLLPLPVLDGGQMLFATISRLRGRPLPVRFIAAAQSLFALLLFSMIIYVTIFGDLRRWVRDAKAETAAREAAAAAAKPAAPAKP